MKIDGLLIDFDEMGFAPTTLCENPDEYACEWKKQLVAEIERLENASVKEFAEKLKQKYAQSCSEYYPELIVLTSEQLDKLLKEYQK